MTASANPTTIRTDVLIIGAGQAGLAAGYHLQRLGSTHGSSKRTPGSATSGDAATSR